jgi:DNA polymerase-3 subunit delta
MMTTLTGSNDFARGQELNKLVTEFLSKYSDLGLEQLEGEDVSLPRVQEALQSQPFLVERKLVILKNPSSNKQFLEQAEALLGDISDSTDLILVEPKIDKRLSYYKFLKKATDFREFNELDIASLVKWLIEFAKSKNGILNLIDARFLVERVGLNQQLLSNEVEKLIMYDPKISQETITLLSEATPQSSIFDLLEVAFNGNSRKALELYHEQRALKVQPQEIMAMLTWQFRILALIKTAGKRTPDEIARDAKLNPFVVRKSLRIANQLSLAKVRSLVNNLLKLDVRLKSEAIDADEALQYYLLTISS